MKPCSVNPGQRPLQVVSAKTQQTVVARNVMAEHARSTMSLTAATTHTVCPTVSAGWEPGGRGQVFLRRFFAGCVSTV